MNALTTDNATHYEQLATFLAANVDNAKLTDAEFRQVVRNSIPELLPYKKERPFSKEPSHG